MKKNVFYSVMAMFMMLFVASCSQDEVMSVNQPDDGMVRLSVKVPAATPNTRADVSVANHKMRCTMEILDKDNNRINIGENTQLSGTVDEAKGTVTFEFEKPEGATKYLFWADYVPSEGNGFYNSGNNKTEGVGFQYITYTANKANNLFNNQAMDAFCACIEDENLEGTITLKRPVVRLAVRADNVDDLGLKDLDKVTPNLYGGNGFNVATGKAIAKGQLKTGNDGADAIDVLSSGNYVFYCYVFPTVADETRGSGITFTSNENETGVTLKIAAEDMQTLTPNTSVSLTGDGGNGKTTVKLEIDNAFSSDVEQ